MQPTNHLKFNDNPLLPPAKEHETNRNLFELHFSGLEEYLRGRGKCSGGAARLVQTCPRSRLASIHVVDSDNWCCCFRWVVLDAAPCHHIFVLPAVEQLRHWAFSNISKEYLVRSFCTFQHIFLDCQPSHIYDQVDISFLCLVLHCAIIRSRF